MDTFTVLLTLIKLKTFVLSIFKWLPKTNFTVDKSDKNILNKLSRTKTICCYLRSYNRLLFLKF